MEQPRSIDLRSDTVTRPTAAMRRAMAEAEVGDDVYGEDPTVNRLEQRVAELLGTEAALFVPSGSMANQIAIQIHTRPGDEVLIGRGSHSFLYESGAASAYGGVQLTVLDGDGRFTAAGVRAAHKPDNHHHPPTRLVMIENTHNMGGGLLWDREEVGQVQAAARELGLALHLDGARLWNAAAAAGRSERELAAGFDSVSVCLSKGLGAPVGSLVAGSRERIQRAHRVRKMMGGGMRQAGILAAAGLYALDQHRARLVEDHENAAFLAGRIADLRGLAVDAGRVDTNIVMVDMEPGLGPAAELTQRARARGLFFGAVAPQRIRLVTHLDVDRAACEAAVDILRGLVAA
ncbi:MAG TPA: low-specificity L-threonine aldolase [Kofleriaceae bacterium]|nr:low-specificity L-threonine aldolase [Kofleriaceae bacterium]